MQLVMPRGRKSSNLHGCAATARPSLALKNLVFPWKTQQIAIFDANIITTPVHFNRELPNEMNLAQTNPNLAPTGALSDTIKGPRPPKTPQGQPPSRILPPRIDVFAAVL